MFDVAVESSFNSVSKWIKEIREEAPENCVIVLCANKTDVPESTWSVPRERFASFASENDLVLYESSAATSYNVNSVSYNTNI